LYICISNKTLQVK